MNLKKNNNNNNNKEQERMALPKSLSQFEGLVLMEVTGTEDNMY